MFLPTPVGCSRPHKKAKASCRLAPSDRSSRIGARADLRSAWSASALRRCPVSAKSHRRGEARVCGSTSFFAHHFFSRRVFLDTFPLALELLPYPPQTISRVASSEPNHFYHHSERRKPRNATTMTHSRVPSTARRAGVASSASAPTTQHSPLTHATHRDEDAEPRTGHGSRTADAPPGPNRGYAGVEAERARAAGPTAGIARVCDGEGEARRYHHWWSTAPRSPQRTNVLYREPNSRHSKTSARAPDGLGQGVSGQPVLPATPPDHQIDRQRCDRASFQAGSPRSQPPLTVRISPHARSHVAWRITHYDQCVSYTRRVA